MNIDIDHELQKTFHEASMQYAQNSLKKGPDWAEADAIMTRSDKERDDLQLTYDEEYPARVDDARMRLLEKAAEFKLDHPAPNGAEPNSNATITQQAQLLVENEHRADMRQSRESEQQDIDQLMERAHHRNLPHGKARQEFNQVNDQRTGLDRRVPDRSR